MSLDISERKRGAEMFRLAVTTCPSGMVMSASTGPSKSQPIRAVALGRDRAQQPQLVRNGVAGLSPMGNQFPDRSVVELPGVFNDLRESI
jgi:hypothetical protein